MKPLSLKARALAILARREAGREELRRKLAPHAADAAELDALLDELAESGWQSDQRFAEMWVNSKSRTHGRLRLQQDLAARGVARETVAEFLPDAEAERLHAVAVLRKKFKAAPADAAERAKQMRFLSYRGFAADTVQAAVRQAWDEDAQDTFFA